MITVTLQQQWPVRIRKHFRSVTTCLVKIAALTAIWLSMLQQQQQQPFQLFSIYVTAYHTTQSYSLSTQPKNRNNNSFYGTVRLRTDNIHGSFYQISHNTASRFTTRRIRHRTCSGYQIEPLAASISTSSSSSSSDASPQPQQQHQSNKRRQSRKDQIRRLFQKAKSLERQGQWRQSVRILRDILLLDPHDAHSHLALARLEARRSPDSMSAVAMFKTGTHFCPNSVHLWQAWAVYEESHGRYNQARELYERALELDPYNPYACHAYGLMELRLENLHKAMELWNKALERSSTAALVCSLGKLHIAQEDYSTAQDLYRYHCQLLKTEREMTEVYLAAAWLEERYLNNFDQAVDLLKTALQISPTSSMVQVALARLEGRRTNGTATTVQLLKETCHRLEEGKLHQPEDGRIYNAWANLEVKANRYTEALQILHRGLTLYPEDHSLLQAAGTAEERVGNYTGARALYSASLSIEPSAPTLVAYALLDMREPKLSNSFDDTKRLFEEALLIDKRHGPAYNAYARAVFQRERDEHQTRSIYERGLHANCTDTASIYHGYAKFELTLGNIERARALLMEGSVEVRRMNLGTDSPHSERAAFLIHTLGTLELNSNRPLIAREVFTDGIKRFGISSQLLLGAALCEVKLGNEDKARQLFERAVLHDDKHAQAWQAWGVMEMKAGNLKTAKTLFECGIRSRPTHGALWQAYGVMESRLHHVENARALFEKGITVAPKLVSLYQSWASLEFREGNYDTARALISQALTMNKRNGSGWLIAAEIEERLGNKGLCNLLLRRGIECCPTDAQLYRSLGDLLVKQGRINEAREILEQGIEIDPTHAPLYHSLAELEARIFNLDALSKLNKKAASIFNANVLQPAPLSFEAWGLKIRAVGRTNNLPKSVAALAERIGEETGSDFDAALDDTDRLDFIDRMISTNIMDDCFDDDVLM